MVADEFHHCGAEEWGKGVTHILDANESAKVVGFSATPIRYSDGGRNMADEMFDGNVAYSMELEEAWLRGILPIPEYIVALYNAPSELEKLAKSITTVRDEAAKKRFQKNSEEALAAAEAFISTHGNEVNDEEHGIGSVTYWTIEVERRTEYKENEWLPCDESGRIDDGYGNEPDAIVAYFSSLEGSREERAFELAKNEYLAWLEHRTDRYTTVYGYMD